MRDQWTELLSDYLDGELPEGERIALEAHLQSCRDCSEILSDLRQVVARARTLEDPAPREDLWPEIARRIGATPARVRTIEPAPWPRAARRWSFSLPQLAAAGIALMTLSGGAVWLIRTPAQQPASPQAVVMPAGTPSVQNAAVSPKETARQSYATAVADLEQVLANGRGQLDTTTVRVIEQNLAAIDRAIAQAQRALDADPANLYLNTHLAETMRRKLDLLRQAAALVRVS
jgi:anti-sigma factor RsiW